MTNIFNIDNRLIELADRAESECAKEFANIERIYTYIYWSKGAESVY